MKSSLSIPDQKIIDLFIKEQKGLPYSYQEVGQTKIGQVKEYDNDHNSILLGKGALVWKNAKATLKKWQHFPPNWTGVYPSDTPLKEGKVVAVLFRVLGVWWMNSARIVYSFDEENRFGFAYGTLPGHIEMGEEVFYVERNEKGEVFYHIKAFSRPRFWLARLGYPFARLYQKQFVKESKARMKTLANRPAEAKI